MTLKPFEEVVAEYGPVVLRVCRAVLGPEDAEDAWSETFLSAMRAYPDLRPDSNVEAWLVTIAHRRALDQYRVRRRSPLPSDEPPEIPTCDPDPDDRDPELWGALAALTLRQRQAIAYHHLAGIPYTEVADLIGGSAAAARRAAADGIKALRRTYPRGADR